MDSPHFVFLFIHPWTFGRFPSLAIITNSTLNVHGQVLRRRYAFSHSLEWNCYTTVNMHHERLTFNFISKKMQGCMCVLANEHIGQNLVHVKPTQYVIHCVSWLLSAPHVKDPRPPACVFQLPDTTCVSKAPFFLVSFLYIERLLWKV